MPAEHRSDRKRKLEEREAAAADAGAAPAFLPVAEPRYLGIRGLCNLGATCYMNAIAQALLSNPLVRNYFLSEQHTRDRCATAARSDVCVACELDTLVVESFRGERSCYNPHRLLYAFWKQALQAGGGAEGCGLHLADNAQQDAHEFFVAFLNVLQAHDRLAGVDDPDNGIVDRAFRGTLRSDVQCRACGTVSTTCEPFLDLSFNLSPAAAAATGARQRGTAAQQPPVTLGDCMNRFIRRESLNCTETFNCRTCGTPQLCTKQLSLSRLPPVLCLHLKRFEHNKNRAKTAKVDTHVAFPLNDLDLSPFQSSTVAHELQGPANLYDLFCVVEHQGDCDSGHYTAFARHVNHAPRGGQPLGEPDDHTEWFQFDDSCVYRATPQAAEQCQAYLLFYVRRQLGYRA